VTSNLGDRVLGTYPAPIGELVADAVERVGVDGVITVEESNTTETSLEVVEGMQFDRGYLSPYFVTDLDRMEAVLEDVFILIHEKKLSSLKDMLPFLERVVKSGRPLLIVAEDVDGEALATLVVNRLRGTLRVAAVKSPGFGDRRKAMLEDLAILTGGRVLAEELGERLENLDVGDLGRAQKVVIDKDTTTIVGGMGKKSDLEARVEQVRAQIEEAKQDYERGKLQERLAKLVGGVAVIRAGAPSEAEMKSKKEALDDAISATKAATAEGIVPGGGLALLRTIAAVEREEAATEGDEQLHFAYRLTPSSVERMAGTVYREIFSLLGRDYLVPLPTAVEVDAALPARDTTLRNFGGSIYAASTSTSAINRSLTVTVAKSLLNEDKELSSSGSEVADEVLVKASVTAIANLPVGAGVIPPGFSSLVTGTWT